MCLIFRQVQFVHGNFVNACTFLYFVYGLLFIVQWYWNNRNVYFQHYILLTFKHYELSLKILKTLTYSGAEVIYMKS